VLDQISALRKLFGALGGAEGASAQETAN